jgi:uncharacterized RDD family membrane protein YckC
MQLVSYWDDTRTRLNTPEQVDLHLEVANVGSRGLALFIDSLIRFGLLMLLWVMYVLASDHGLMSDTLSLGRKGFLILLICLLFASEWVYFALFEWVWNGQTPGKRLLRLRVIKEDGAPITFLEIIIRNFMRPVDCSGPMALVGLGFIFFHPRSQRVGDVLARTIVVRESKIDWDLFRLPEEKPAAVRRTRVVLEPVQLEMLQRYLHRVRGMEPSIAEELGGKLRRALRAQIKGTDLDHAEGSARAWLEEMAARL